MTMQVYSVNKNIYPPLRFSNFSQRLRIFKQNFTRLLYAHIYGKLQNVIQLSLNLTKVCHIKCNARLADTKKE